MKSIIRYVAFVAGLLTAAAQAQTVKIAFIEGLSGGGASLGEVALKHFQFFAEHINARGGLNGEKIEIVPFDSKTVAQEALVQAQKATDQGIRIIAQGNGSAVAAALIDFVNKHNERNPGEEVLYLAYSSLDPALTGEKCSYWHYRWYGHSDIKVGVIASFIKSRPNIKKIYLINQDYSLGQSTRVTARRLLKELRPDVEIVGDELHPLLKITDFAPYAAKIKASGADTVITNNWGQDISLLLKAAADGGLQVDWYAPSSHGAGGPTAIKQSGLADHVFTFVEWNPNGAPAESQSLESAFRDKYHAGFWYPSVANLFQMLSQAAAEAKTTNVKALAASLEGMKAKGFNGDEIWMRKDDHQVFQDMFVLTFAPKTEAIRYDEENTGWGWKTVAEIPAADTVQPNTCRMNRPSQ